MLSHQFWSGFSIGIQIVLGVACIVFSVIYARAKHNPAFAATLESGLSKICKLSN